VASRPIGRGAAQLRQTRIPAPWACIGY